MTDHAQALEALRSAFKALRYEFSRHAVLRMLGRDITTHEIEEAVETGEIIEPYPTDKYGPSYLLFGRTRGGRPLHVQVAISRMRVVTVYEPDPREWIEFRERRSPGETR